MNDLALILVSLGFIAKRSSFRLQYSARCLIKTGPAWDAISSSCRGRIYVENAPTALINQSNNIKVDIGPSAAAGLRWGAPKTITPRSAREVFCRIKAAFRCK
jgi:hypothetical protein